MAFGPQIYSRRSVGAFLVVVVVLALAALHAPARSPARTEAAVATATEAARNTSRATAAPAARSASRSAADHGRSAELLASKAIQEITREMRDHIARSPRYAELASCDSSASLACRALLSQAIYEAMDVRVMAQTTRGGLGLSKLTHRDADAVYSTVSRVLLESADDLERTGALLLLRSLPSLPTRPLPEGAYRNLSERTVAEAQLTLQQPIGGPLPYPEAARELITLFTHDRDSRLQDSALSALAYPETEPELLAAVRETARKQGPEWPDWLSSVAPAIGTCGIACIETVDAVLDASGDNPAVAEEMLRAFPESDRVALTERMKDRFEPKALLALATSAGVELPTGP